MKTREVDVPESGVGRAYRGYWITVLDKVIDASKRGRALEIPLGDRSINALRTAMYTMASRRGLKLHVLQNGDKKVIVWLNGKAR
jgi:hypothetical protein